MPKYREKRAEVEAIRVRDIVTSPAGDWSNFPSWLKQLHSDGKMIIYPQGITILSADRPLAIRLDDYITRRSDGEIGWLPAILIETNYELVA